MFLNLLGLSGVNNIGFGQGRHDPPGRRHRSQNVTDQYRKARPIPAALPKVLRTAYSAAAALAC
jgi:hypothetical protein